MSQGHPMHPTVEESRELVRPYFINEFDQGGQSMFSHLERVVKNVEAYGEKFVHVAWLHDLVEDTNVTLEDLRLIGYSPDILLAVELLTRPMETPYAAYIDRLIASGNPLALIVKIGDQMDNTNPNRMGYLPEIYRKALQKRYNGVLPRLIEAAAKVI